MTCRGLILVAALVGCSPVADMPETTMPRPVNPRTAQLVEFERIEMNRTSSPAAVARASRAKRSDRKPATGVWDRLAKCESGGRWHIATGNGYFGGLQFSLRSWRWVGGSGYPHQHSRDEQIKRARLLLARQGWAAWPACSRKLGLR